jgi:Domain of unknown function (DUF3472)
MKGIHLRKFSIILIVAAWITSYLNVHAAPPRNPQDPPQHIVEIPYKFKSASLPTYWSGTQTGHYNFDYHVSIDKMSSGVNSMFWANHFYFGNRSGSGGQGYTGLQILHNGDKTAIFSIWGATIDPSNSNCQQGHELGAVASCIMPYDWKVGHKYRFRIWEIEDARKPDEDEWWGAWVYDVNTDKETFIAKLKVPGNLKWLKSAVSFVEYFGPLPQKCDTKIPYSKATFSLLQADKNTFEGTPTAELSPSSYFACASKLLKKKTCTPKSGCVIEVERK